jgi:hypothetical protein
MDFAGKRIFVVGATHTPQPMPFAPSQSARDLSISPQGWSINDLPPSFLCEITFEFGVPKGKNATAGFSFTSGNDGVSLTFDSISNEVGFCEGDARKLDPEFDWTAKHLVRIEADYDNLKVSLDGANIPVCSHRLTGPVESVIAFSENIDVAISSFQLTEGFEELFENDHDLRLNGWEISREASCSIESGELLVNAESRIDITKHRPLRHCEFAANFRITDADRVGRFGIILRAGRNDLLSLSIDTSDATLSINNQPTSRIPDGVALDAYHQLRIIKSGVEAFCYFDDLLIKTLETDDVACSALLFCDRASVAIEMIRLTSI